MLTFSHPGKIGDLLYSLHYCIDCMHAAGEPCFAFNIQTGRSPIQINPQWKDSNALLTDKDALFIKPLLETQTYIANVTTNSDRTGIDLAGYMCCSLNQMGGDIRDYYYQVDGNMYPREFWKPLISADRDTRYNPYRERIIIGRTGRYDNLLMDWKALKEFADRLVFLGTADEYDDFRSNYFDLDGVVPGEADSLLDCARMMVSCKGYISGQSGIYALAEMMKIPRILITPDWMKTQQRDNSDKIVAAPGPKNVHPAGGLCATANRTDRLMSALITWLG